jgi:hypothetical protein
VPITQAEKLANKLAANDVPYIYAPFKGGYHGYDFFKDANPGVMYLIEEFLAELREFCVNQLSTVVHSCA